MAASFLMARPAAAQTGGWNLVWSDEFNGPAGSAPSSSDWVFVDNNATPGNANGELEFYCAPSDNTSPCSTATPNFFMDGNGNLVVSTIHTSSGTWTSGRMKTEGFHEFQYGRMEASMKLTVGDGLWPAFWMLGSNRATVGWPTCGEQDIMEWVPQYGPTTTSSTIHGPGYGPGARFTFPNGGTVNGSFHSYGVVWWQNEMQYYRDDWTKPFLTLTPANISPTATWEFNHPFYLITNQAVGGNFPTPGPDSSTPNPSNVLIDYIRAYQWSGPIPAPAGLTAAAGDSEVGLSWGSSIMASAYNVLRGTTSGGPYTAITPAGGITTTYITDKTVTNGTTYFYVVTAQDSSGNLSGNSNEASTTPTSNLTPVISINSGGPAVSPFVADVDFTGGSTTTHANTIDLSGVTNPAPMQVYQTGRIGSFSYTIPGLTSGAGITVRLHFAEIYFTTSGSRIFNVSINGSQVLTDFDIFAAAGAGNKAVIEQFVTTPNSSGQVVIQFTSVKDNSMVNGIEIKVASTASCSAPTASTLTAASASPTQINLSWTASSSSCAVTYNVFRSTTSGFTPSSSNQIASGLTATSFSDTGLTASTTYFYLVQATNSGGTSTSNEASATTGQVCSTVPAAPTGLGATGTGPVSLSWTGSAVPAGCSSVTYSVFRSTTSGFTPSSGNQITSGVTATSFSDTTTLCGNTYFYLVEAVDSAGSSGASNQASATTSTCPTGPQINSGGPAVSPFVADEFFTASATINHANTIDLTGVTNPAPMAVYQTARIGNFTYTIPNFTAGSSHLVRLHFAETYFSAAGSRTFNVTINGTQVLAKFDIFATAGAKNKAVIEQFTEAANSSGQFVIQFTSVVNNSLVSGIEVQ